MFIKTKISKLVRTTHFWKNLHQVHSMPKNLKAKELEYAPYDTNMTHYEN